MPVIGALEAKTKFSQLLDRVEQGEEVTITRHGKEVARLVAPKAPLNRAAARAAVQRLRDRAEQCQLGPFDWTEWKSLRDEGRP